MKKLVLTLCLILALCCAGALAEAVDEAPQMVEGKVVLGEYTVSSLDENNNTVENTVKVTLEVDKPVALYVVDADEEAPEWGIYDVIGREDLANIIVSITPAHMGDHWNLNNYTDEELQKYIDAIVEGNYDPATVKSEVLVSAGGNTYVAIEDKNVRSISTIYDDFVMELIQFRLDEDYNILPLTDEDRAFALEIFQGIWTE